MATDFPSAAIPAAPSSRVWQVGALCRAVADVLEARFGAVTVQGEVSGFSRAASGHCYFSLKDEGGQLRCAMFRRAATLLPWQPREGDLVEVRGRLAVYEARGELQLVVESMRRAGAGALYEDFLQRKAELQAQGLFDAQRKRPLAPFPRGIGLVTSLGAAALHDVATTLQRRAPHVPVLLAPALVQGAGAPVSLVEALHRLYRIVQRQQAGEVLPGVPPIDTLLLVRGGGSMEDLWAFNDTQLAHTIVQSPIPLVCGVGHETDFTIADFCADVRAPTPTAAAELAVMPAAQAWQQAAYWQQRLQQRVQRQLEQSVQGLDRIAWGFARTSAALHLQQTRLQALQWRLQRQQQQGFAGPRTHLQRLDWQLARTTRNVLSLPAQAARLQQAEQRLAAACGTVLREQGAARQRLEDEWMQALRLRLDAARQRVALKAQQVRLLDPRHALQRGYALLQDDRGRVLSARADFYAGQRVQATVRDGCIDLTPLARQQSLDESA